MTPAASRPTPALTQPPPLAGILIRPFAAADEPAFVDAVQDSRRSLSDWLDWAKDDYSQADAGDWFALCAADRQAGTAHEFGIFSETTGQLLGGIGIHGIDPQHRYGALGYWIRRSHQWRGIATQASRAAASYAFETLRLERVEIVVAEGNLASRRVAEKLGATYEGLARNRLRIAGRRHHAAIYALFPISGNSAAS